MSTISYNLLKVPYNIDRKLYKYYPIDKINYVIDAISNRRIHLDDPSNFNDPFEAVYCTKIYSKLTDVKPVNSIVAQILKYLSVAAKELNTFQANRIHDELIAYIVSHNEVLTCRKIDETSNVIKQLYDNFGEVDFSYEGFCELIDTGFYIQDGHYHINCKISCFSEINDSILMWSYYASNHEGVCLEFDLDKLPQNELTKQIISSISKVHYSPIRTDNLLGKGDESVVNLLASKADVWSHEHEWRIICETDQEYIPFDCITNIYVGMKIINC